MIQYGELKFIPALKRLWKECFADEDSYIDAFFDALYDDRNILLAQENGVLMGASFFLPGRIYYNGDWREIRYVYALAVDAQFRGRGTAGGLLRAAYKEYQAPLAAEPADAGLADGFYEPLGFIKYFYYKQVQIELQPEPQAQYDMQAAQLSSKAADMQQGGRQASVHFGFHVSAIHAEQYCSMRDQLFCRQGCVSWPMQHTAFAVAQHCAQGGEALCITSKGREDILLYYIEDGKAAVTETTLGQEAAVHVLLNRQPWISGVKIRQAIPDTGQSQLGEDFKLIGMVYGLAPVPGSFGYLNLSLD